MRRKMQRSQNAMSTADCLIIVPTYNERDNLPLLVERIEATVPQCHLLIVDDGSPDATADLADALFGARPDRHVMRRTGRRGLGRSYVDGYLWAIERGYSLVVQMDADLSHDPAYIPELLQAATRANVVLGSRYCPGGGVENWPWTRLALSRFANAYVAAITGLLVRDATSGFRCYTREALQRIQVSRITSNGYAFQVEMTYRAYRAGLTIAEVPITFTDRRRGKSKISRAVLLESMIVPWRLRFQVRSAEAGSIPPILDPNAQRRERP
ncbi:MAG: polyprenol monophosphomannose synthase [Chthonomonadales bacterium]